MNNNKQFKLASLFVCIGLTTQLVGCNTVEMDSKGDTHAKEITSKNLDIWPKLDIAVKPDAAIEQKVQTLLSSMTLEQKIAQMIQPEIRDFTVEDMRKYGFGSYLNGGGSFPNGNKHATPKEWIKLAEDMYQASVDDTLDGSAIPTMWGTDAVHGHNNVIGATLFPHNIGLGAANNPALIEQVAAITAKEVMVTGIDWVFAPTVAVVRDDRWGRTYEGYSEDPAIVKSYSSAIVKGLQGAADGDFLSDKRVISTVKHFLGDGGTVAGDDQGDNIDTEQQLFDIHAQGYVGGLSAGSQSVMASFNSWHGKKNHGSKYLLTDVLKTKMGFDGFVVGDWNGHGQVEGCSNDSCPQAVNAGLDIFMVPTDAWKPLLENTIAQVKSGEISMARIDDAVTRILRVKYRAGLFNKASPANRPFSGKTELIGAVEHRDIARQAVRESLVLLKNKGNILPLSPNSKVLVAGSGADNIGQQTGGWSITWQGTNNENKDFPGASSIYDGIKAQVQNAGGTVELTKNDSYQQKPDVAIVVFGEEPYAEGHGDRENLDFQRGDKQALQLLKKLKADGIPTVSLFISGRPMWVNAEFNASNAFVAAWLPGTEADGIAQVLFKKASGEVQYDFTGKLSFSWPKSPIQTTVNIGDKNYSDNSSKPLFPYGYGLKYGEQSLVSDSLSESYVKDTSKIKARKIFTGTMQKPWLMWLFSDNEQLEVNSNALKLAGLSYRTIDKVVQEDAISLDFAGDKDSGLRIASKSSFREDLRSELENKAALTFEIKVSQTPTKAVYLSTRCDGEGDCGAKLDITNQIKHVFDIKKWQSLSIDLQCFADKGMKMADLVVPFELKTDGALSLSLTNIQIEPNKAKTADISCQ